MEGTVVAEAGEAAPAACTITPWLSVRESAKAVDFYKAAFHAVEVYRMKGAAGDVVARLSVNGAEFWLSEESPEHGNASPARGVGSTVHMILTVPDPDAVFAEARMLGAEEVYPMGQAHGWRVGRIVDPFGHHWEIGRPVSEHL